MNAPDTAREIELAEQPLDSADAALLNSLRAFYDETDPVPDGLVERIQFELTLDALHAEIATLMQMDLAGAGVRSAATEDVRTITFTSESVTTMVSLTPQPDGTVRVDGWATLSAEGGDVRVELLSATATLATSADEDGRFVFENAPRGLAKFALHVTRGDTSATVITPTLEL